MWLRGEVFFTLTTGVGVGGAQEHKSLTHPLPAWPPPEPA